MEQFFNYGQIFHHAQLKYGLNGKIPADQIRRWKDEIPASMFKFGRFSGTMSNFMALDLPGYNFKTLSDQINNQRKAQPTESYLYRWAELVDQLGIQQVIFCVNIHKAYLEGGPWIDRMLAAYEFMKENTPLYAIELGNECNMEPLITGSKGGSPNPLERIIYGHGLKPADQAIAERVNRYLDFLQLYSSYFDPYPIAVTVARNQTVRDNTFNREVLKRNFYNAVVPHIYLTTKTYQDTYTAARQWLTPFVGKRIWVTEWNYNYAVEAKPAGTFHNDRGRFGYRAACIEAMQDAGVELSGFHTIWAGDVNINNW